MPELAWVFFVLAIIWGVVTVCGHLSWVVTATFLKAIFGDHQAPAAAKPCPRCGRLSLIGGQCSHCGSVPIVSVEQRTRDDLLATAKQLTRLQRAGHLPYDQCVELLKVLERDLAHIGVTLPPELWKRLDLQPQLKGGPAEPASLSEVTVSTPAARSESDVDATVLDAVLVDEPAIQPAPLSPASESPFAPAFATNAAAVSRESQPIALPPPLKSTPSRTLADMLQGFMEDSNIRWFEVIAGLVIVISAIGLVRSLQATLQHIPYFPALLFMLFTVSFHGAGLYTLRRWKLATVSRAILVIALLLVPLSFAAGVVLSGPGDVQRPLTDPLFLTAMVVGFGVFGWVSYSGSRELTGEGALRLTAAILGCSFAQVVINRGVASGLPRQTLTLLALLPVASYLIAAIGQIFRAQAWQRMSSKRIEQTFLILGISSFALLPPLALLILKVEPRWPTFVQLAPLLSLVATSILTLGLVVHRRALAKPLATLRTSGTAVALVGGALLIFLWVVVWPRPELMLNVSLLTGVLLLAIAIRTGLPALHAAALGVLSVAVFVGFVWWQELVRVDNAQGVYWVQAALLGRSSILLTVLAAAIGGCGAWLFTKRNGRLGIAYLATAGVLSVLSLLIAGWSGFVPLAAPWTGDGDLTGPLFLCYGVALLAIAITITSEHILAAGMALLWIALIQLLSANETARTMLLNMHLLPERPVLVATILEGVILAVIAFVLSKPSRKLLAELFWEAESDQQPNPLIVPLTHGAATAIVAATPFILWVVPGQFGVHALYALLAALVWGIVCVARRWPAALAALQAMGAVATAFAIARWWAPDQADHLWFARGGHLQAQLLALAATAGVWSLIRRFAQPRTVLHDLLHPVFPACDHVLLGLGVMLVTVLAISSALPGIAWELGVGAERLTSADIPWLDLAHLRRLAWGVAAITGALSLALVNRITGLKLAGLAITGWAGLFVLAQLWQIEVATASAARWLLVLYGSGLMLLFVFRGTLQRGLQTQSWLRYEEPEPEVREWFRFQPLVLGVLPMLVLTIIAVAQNASGVSLRGPLTESIFSRIGPTASYAGPMLIGVTIFLGLALGQRQSAFALGGALLFQLAANLAFILHISGQGPAPEGVRWAEGLQWNTIAAAIYSLLWFGLSTWLLPRDAKLGPLRLKRDSYFLVYIAASVWLLFSVGIWAAAGIIRFPDTLAAESRYLGHWSNALAAALLVMPLLGAFGVSRVRRTWALGATATVLLATAIMPVLAIRWEAVRGVGTWSAYHLLELGWLSVAAIVALAYAWQERNTTTAVLSPERRSSRGYAPHHALAAVLCGLLTFLAIRGNYYDPAQPFFSASVLGGVCAVLVALGVARRSQPYALASLLAGPIAAALPWFTPASRTWWMALNPAGLPVALNGCLLAATLIGGWWQWMEIRAQQRSSQTFSPRWFGPLTGHLAIGIVTLVLAVISYLHLLVVGSGRYAGPWSGFDWGLVAMFATWLALGIVSVGTLWDRRALFIFPVLLVWLWIGCALGLAPLQLRPLPMYCLHALATAAVIALAGHFWSYGANLAVWGEKLGISDTIGGLTRIDCWLPTLTLVIGLAICLLELFGMWNLPLREQRVAIAFAPALIAYAVACLAQQKRRSAFHLTALLLGGLSCVYLGWSDLNPGWQLSDWMTRAFRLLMVLAGVTFGYGWALPRLLFRDPSWLRASQVAGYVSSVLAFTTLISLLALEISLFQPGIGAGVDGLQVGAVAVLLVLFIVGLISLAVAPGAATAEEQWRRTWFVYGAQVVAGLLFAHLYLCQPGWFDGVLKPYWPYVVMAIAFSGVGLGELFWRLRLPVLAEPFQRTGSFLPVLPILGLWVAQSKNDYDYTLLLFFAGLMYLILSVVRKSWPAAIAAAVAGNGALWALLKQSDWSIVQHPQFWLIPPAVSVLVAAQINRRRLNNEMLSAIRYGSLIVIYVSSTFEIFLHRAETSLWPPVILALLSLAGSLAGVLLRIRAFLYLGAVFTLLAMVSMVWHAARAIDHVWPWWLFGIGMGIAILGLLAFFEKNRPQVQALVQRLRQWDT